MRNRRTLARAAATVGVVSLACLDDSPTAPIAADGHARLRIQAHITGGQSVDRTLRIRAFYRRGGAGAAVPEIDLPSSPSEIVVASGTTRSQEVIVNLTSCFADAQRVAPESGCRFSIELTLIDVDGEMLSRQSQEVNASAADATVEPPPIVLPAAEIGLASTTMTLTAEELAIVPAGRSVAITSVTGAPLGTLSATVTYASGTGWLNHSIDQNTRTLTLQPSTTEPVAPVSYSATVTVRSSRAGVASKDIAVTYTVTPRARPLFVAMQGTGTGRVTSTPAGIDCMLGETSAGGACGATFPHGTQVTLTAAANAGSTFTGFTEACTGATCQVTMDQPRDQQRTVRAEFAIVRHRLAVTGAGTGSGRILSDPAGIDCNFNGASVSGACNADFNAGTRVTLSATPATGSSFTGFSGACEGTSCQVTMDQARSVAASFVVIRHRLTITPATGSGSGSVVSTPAGIDCTITGGDRSGTCTAEFNHGTQLTLTASPQPGSTFDGFSGSCEGPSCQVTMDQARNVVVTFTLRLHRLAVTASGNGAGSVTSSPAGIDCAANNGSVTGACSAEFAPGTRVTLTATAQPGSSFAGFGGACEGTACEVIMDQPRSVAATFTLVRHRLTVTANGNGSGTVRSNPAGIDCSVSNGSATGTCGADFAAGTQVTLTATAQSGSNFTGFSGACTGASCHVTMSEPRAVAAAFSVATYRLTVSGGGGDGSGRVTSNPAGIDCAIAAGTASGDCTEDFAAGSSVTLAATPASGDDFAGWANDCADRGQCAVTIAPNDANAVIATFTAPTAGRGTVSGRVYSAATNAGLGGAQVRLFRSEGPAMVRVTTGADGRWATGPLPRSRSNSYWAMIHAEGHIATAILNLVVDGDLVTEATPLAPNSSVGGSIAGVVRDATTGDPITGSATLELRRHMNATTGEPLATTTTGAGGSFAFSNHQPGTFTILVRATGYADATRTVAIVGGESREAQDVFLSPIGGGAAVRIVLSWAATPRDLDSHLFGPADGGARFHVYYASQGNCAADPFACLDHDDTDGNGPETVTITQQLAGVYRYAVHNYSDEAPISTSNGRVDLYIGNRLARTFGVPQGTGIWWTVFELNGTTVTPINTISDTEPMAQVAAPTGPLTQRVRPKVSTMGPRRVP